MTIQTPKTELREHILNLIVVMDTGELEQTVEEIMVAVEDFITKNYPVQPDTGWDKS